MSQVNPYANTSPGYSQQAYPTADYFQPVDRFDIGRVIKSPFVSPNWVMNVIWVAICMLLSMVVIGNIVLFGYLAEVAEARSGGRDKNWPDFDFDRFSDYLLRGLWAFLWNLIGVIPLLLFIGIPVGITIATIASIQQGNELTGTGVLVLVAGVVTTLMFTIFAAIVMMVSMAHASLGNDFLKGADLPWIFSFLSKMAGTLFFAAILMFCVSLLAHFLGLLACGIGIFVSAPLVNMMCADALAQLHDIFLTRGGVSAFEITSHKDVVDAQVLGRPAE